jgi:Tol biopolymer transport system component
MPLAPGTQLGPYEIVAPLGAGGMGEVYRARDTRLDRTVAIKILPAQFSSDPIRKQRFEREAKTISSLNHPHICVLHDIGHQDGTDYLVMECVEGETLAKRLEKGPLPFDQALQYGSQIAAALDKAHRSGVVHRDLKPGNIMVTKSGVKLLDFGLAKPVSEAFASGETLSISPARNRPLTAEGAIVGTMQYMSPEQLEGKETDGRSDLFSFGAVLYEMLTGNHAFDGKSQASVIAAVLEHEPEPLSAVQPMAPPALDQLIRTCIAKDPEERIQTAHDVKLQLQWIAGKGSQAGEARRIQVGRGRWHYAGWLVATVFFVSMMAAGVAWWRAGSRHVRPMYFHASVPFLAHDLALSPDGQTVAMVSYSAQANKYALWTYEIGSRQTSLLNGTQGASYPFWSPDGKFVGFFADGKLKKVDVSKGQVQVLCDAPNGRGGTWNRDGVIVFTPDSLGVGLFRVSSSGGSPVELTKPETSGQEESHRWPVFLPDGKHFLYMVANFSGEQSGINAIFIGSLDSQQKSRVVSASANAAYAEPGYLLYMRDNKTLVAQDFDPQRYVLSGEPHTVSEEVLTFPHVYRAVFSVSSGGVLVTQTGKGASISQLSWFDRSGKLVDTAGPPGTYNNVSLSPDGRRVATDETDADGWNIDVWIREPSRSATTRLTFNPSLDTTPIWSPDGKQVLFASNRKVGFRLYLKNADGSGSEQEVSDIGVHSQVNAWDWSRDSKHILVRKGGELWHLSWPERVARPLLQAKWTVRNAQFSRDGHWIAYASNETGNMEIYVSPFPGMNGKWQVSSVGGEEPRWRQDGKELFYLSPEGKMMAVAVTLGASLEAGAPVPLFQTHRRQAISAQDVFSYDVSPDGQRFFIATKADEANAAPLSVLLNWSSEMEK